MIGRAHIHPTGRMTINLRMQTVKERRACEDFLSMVDDVGINERTKYEVTARLTKLKDGKKGIIIEIGNNVTKKG